jgi:hypothetical protein
MMVCWNLLCNLHPLFESLNELVDRRYKRLVDNDYEDPM